MSLTQSDTEREGNTKSSRTRNYCFTVNNYSNIELDSIEKYLNNSNCDYVLGLEVGEEGTPHIQGCIKFKNPVYFSALKKNIPRAHIETQKGTWQQNIDYCTKGQKYKTNMKKLMLIQSMTQMTQTFRPWQSEVLEIIKNEPDDRTIHWIYDFEGNSGKTWFSKYLFINHNAVYIDSGKAADIKFLFKDTYDKKNIDVCVFDFTRSVEGFVSYSALESIKNGIMFSSKYECSSFVFPIPHVIVFANFKPEMKKLSLDRWAIYSILEQELIPEVFEVFD